MLGWMSDTELDPEGSWVLDVSECFTGSSYWAVGSVGPLSFCSKLNSSCLQNLDFIILYL